MMANTNIYGLVWNASHAAAVNQQEHDNAELLIAVFLSEKVRAFGLLDEKEQVKLLRKFPNYQHEVGLLEEVTIDGERETLNERFIEMAQNARNKQVRVGHSLQVKHLCYRHSLSQAAAQWHDTPQGERGGFRYPAFTVMGEEYNSTFIETSTFSVAYLKEKKPQSVESLIAKFKGVSQNKTVKIVGATKNLHQQELDAQDKENAKLLEKIAKLQAENAALASRTPVEEVVSSPASDAPPTSATIQ